MRVLFHQVHAGCLPLRVITYFEISPGLAARFQKEVDAAIEAVKLSPSSAGHYLNIGSKIVPELRRRNLRAFPFFILYGSSSNG